MHERCVQGLYLEGSSQLTRMTLRQTARPHLSWFSGVQLLAQRNGILRGYDCHNGRTKWGMGRIPGPERQGLRMPSGRLGCDTYTSNVHLSVTPSTRGAYDFLTFVKSGNTAPNADLNIVLAARTLAAYIV